MRRGNAEESAALEEQLTNIRSDPRRVHLMAAFKALRLAWDGKFRKPMKVFPVAGTECTMRSTEYCAARSVRYFLP